MKNFVQAGLIMACLSPYARLAGEGALVGALFGVCVNDAANGADVELQIEGVFDLTKLATDVVAVGDKVYWDNTNKRCTVTASGNTLVGVATQAQINGDTTVRVRLTGQV